MTFPDFLLRSFNFVERSERNNHGCKALPDRSDLESKTREDLQTIAKVKGVDVSARASKASLIEAIMGDPAPANDASIPFHAPYARDAPSRHRLTTSMTCSVSSSPTRPALAPTPPPPSTPDDRDSALGAEHERLRTAPAEPSSKHPTAPGTPTRDFGNDTAGRNRRNRRNRNGRERFGGDSMPNADQPYAGELLEIEGLLDLRDDGYGFLRTRATTRRRTTSTSRSTRFGVITCERRFHIGGFRPAASNEKYPALLRVDSVAGSIRKWRDCARDSRT